MPSRKFLHHLSPERDIQIEISWKFFWKDIVVKIDKKEAYKIESKKALDKGVEFFFDGNKYSIQMKLIFLSPQLIVEINDQPVSGSSNDPKTMVRSGFYLLFFLIGLNTVVGLTSILGNVEFLQKAGIGYYNLFAAFVYILCFGISKNFNLLVGLCGGFLYFVLDWVIGIITWSKSSPDMISSSVVMRLMLCTLFFLACKGAYQLQGKIVGHEEVSIK